ncbi:MAG: hypothetical protein R3218_04295, partial [Christiangramia sp.]|nr:hypothetical protein [Christiangramia sp.]
GDFDFLSLVPHHREIHILLNNDLSETYNSSYESVYVSVKSLTDNEIHLPSLNLNKAAKVKVVLMNNSGVEQGNLQIIYPEPVRFLLYDQGELSELEEEIFNDRTISSEIIPETLEVDFSSTAGEEVRVILNYNEQQEERVLSIQPGIERYEIEF